MKIFFDARWTGNFGIGRVSNMLNERLCLPPLKIDGNPASPFDPIRLVIAMLKSPSDAVFFSPGYNAPLFVLRPYIFMIHDLNHIDRAENSSLMKKLYYHFIMRRACQNAACVLTGSEFSRQRILKWANVPERHVVNVGYGVGDNFNPGVSPYLPGYQYVLCVSNRKLHKNEARLIKAFANAKACSTFHLLFTGMASEHLLSIANDLGVKDRIIFCGNVSDELLASLYKGAKALLFPSLYEGFGLPALEAMACGCPVLVSNTTALPEVCGDAALYCDPYDTNDIAEKITLIINNEDLCKSMKQKGLERAKSFSWDQCALKTWSVIEKVLNENCNHS